VFEECGRTGRARVRGPRSNRSAMQFRSCASYTRNPVYWVEGLSGLTNKHAPVGTSRPLL
jgi:hypothetical protein